jgi:L-iditol 2-dehydrogenase
MKALFKTKKGFGNVELLEIAEPKCGDSEIKIRIEAIGICGTDLHIYEGSFPYFNPPVILGHEFSGVIVEIGRNVKNIKNLNIGDRIVVLPSAAVICGNCEYCRSGNFIFCSTRKGMGHGVNGGMTEYICLREELVFKLPENVSFEAGSLVEPLSCCIQSVDDFVNIKPTQYCLVSGPGSIGLLILMLLKLRNSNVILAGISKDEKRLEVAKKLGADLALNVEKEDLTAILQNKFGIKEVDVCFECSGAGKSLNSCITYSKKMGSIIQVGIFGNDQVIRINDIVLKQIALFGSLGFTWKSWLKSLELLKNNKLKLDIIVTHKYKLDSWSDAFEKAQEPDSLKVILEPF